MRTPTWKVPTAKVLQRLSSNSMVTQTVVYQLPLRHYLDRAGDLQDSTGGGARTVSVEEATMVGLAEGAEEVEVDLMTGD